MLFRSQGKLQCQTLEDALTLAKDNGIRKAETIIKEVASAICKFRKYAEECGVGQQWIAAVETCLNNHLANWGFLPDSSSPSFDILSYSVTTRHNCCCPRQRSS